LFHAVNLKALALAVLSNGRFAFGEAPGVGKAEPLFGTRDQGKASIKPKAILGGLAPDQWNKGG
jgi:hypothetical protein